MQDLNYQIFLLEPNGNYAELDAQGIDFSTAFSLSDIKDITTKKDTLARNITIQGTKNNNRIFGNVFNQSRFVDATIEENLFVNFSVNKQVECIVLENSVPILKGFLKFTSAEIDKGKVTYEVIITGNIFNFFSSLGDLMLSDLDFVEYVHEYTVDNIMYSYDDFIYYSGDTVPTGTGYVYPMINYADGASPRSEDINKIHINNFRPAIYTKTYMDKIFQQPVLSGFTYEIKGSNEFLDNFKHTIIPDNQDLLSQSRTGLELFNLNKNDSKTDSYTDDSITFTGTIWQIIDFPDTASIQIDAITPNTTKNYQDELMKIFIWNRTCTTDMQIKFGVISVTNHSAKVLNCYARLFSRPRVFDQNSSAWNAFTNFSVVGEAFVGEIAPGGGTLTKNAFELNIPQMTFSIDTEFIVALNIVQPNNQSFKLLLDVSSADVTIHTPSNSNNLVTYSVVYGDDIKPQPVSNIKQKDFVRSLCLLFNLYTYSSLENPKHIIFQPYDDYYEFCRPENIQSTALDYTGKVDYSDKVTFSSYGELAKKYSFTYKSDNDYFNELYFNDYQTIYGAFTETDSLGVTDESKVELIFSPTPVVNFGNTGRITPEIYKQDSTGKKTPFVSNIRILYFNGKKPSSALYEVGKMVFDGTNYNFTAYDSSYELTFYGQASHIRTPYGLTGTTYVSDLNFAGANRYYFPVDVDMLDDTPNAYQAYYQNQIRELTNANMVLLESKVLLSESDISNLDLRTPVFINNQYGNAYYKVIEIDYTNRLETSTVKMQKVNI